MLRDLMELERGFCFFKASFFHHFDILPSE